MHIIARNITNLTDARYFAAKEVNFLAFNLEAGTPGYLDPMYMQAMREWVQGPAITGEFNESTSLAVLNEAIRFYQLDAVIVPPTIDAAAVEGAQVIVKLRVEHATPIPVPANNTGITALLLEKADANSTWISFKNALEAVELPCFLQFDASLAELQETGQTLRPHGLSLTGGEEEAVGIKSFDELEDIFDWMAASADTEQQ